MSDASLDELRRQEIVMHIEQMQTDIAHKRLMTNLEGKRFWITVISTAFAGAGVIVAAFAAGAAWLRFVVQ